MEFIAANFAPVMFGGLVFFLILGFPVAFSLGACGLFFAFLGIQLDVFPPKILAWLPQRLFGIMSNETLLAVPFFTLMGLILERSGMAEDLLNTIGQVFGPIRGGLAYAVVFVGALLAATTGVVSASVISMGLISMPIMLRYGYSRTLTSGVITAAGTLAQIIPPSLVLIVLADQIGRSVGDMYKGAFVPAFCLVGLYTLYVMGLSIFQPRSTPALPLEAREFVEPSGSHGYPSLAVLMAISMTVSIFTARHLADIQTWWTGQLVESVPTDETIVIAACGGAFIALLIAGIDKFTHLGLLSKLAQRVTFVLIPPLLLIFLVLGTIFLGVATPTEGGAMGAMGALVLALAWRRINMPLLTQALISTTKLSSFVMFIVIGATVFSMVFQAADGPRWVEALMGQLPGGHTGFLIFVNVLIFFLAFFLDFFELSFIVVPIIAPIAHNMGIDLIWLGVLLAMTMQTSFLHPPFGFALFYLRSVAPEKAYRDPVTGKRMEPVTTMQIYKGAIPFLVLQVIMVALLIAFPGLVTRALDPVTEVDMDAVGTQMLEDLESEGFGFDFDLGSEFQLGDPDAASTPEAAIPDAGPDTGLTLPPADFGTLSDEPDDPMKALEDTPQ